MNELALRKLIREILLESGTHQFHGYKVQNNIEKFGIPGPQFSDSRPVSDEDENLAADYVTEHDPDELIAYSRGAAVVQEIPDEEYDEHVNKITYVAPAAERGWTNDPVRQAPSGSEMWAVSGDGAVPLKQACSIAKDAGIASVNVWHTPAEEMIGSPRRSNSKKTHHWRSLGFEEHDFAMDYITKRRKADITLDSGQCSEDPGLPDWETSSSEPDEIEQQWKWVDDQLSEADIRRLVRSLLLEKKKKKKKRKVKCPLLPNGKRDYKCEYRKYGGASKKGKKERAARNKARKQAEREGLVKKGDGMELDHIMPLSLGGSNDPKNWQVITRSENRKKGKSWDGKSGHMDETQKKGKSKKKGKKK